MNEFKPAREAPLFNSDPSPTGEMSLNELLSQIYDAEYVQILGRDFDDSGDFISKQPHSVFPPDSRVVFNGLGIVTRIRSRLIQ